MAPGAPSPLSSDSVALGGIAATERSFDRPLGSRPRDSPSSLCPPASPQDPVVGSPGRSPQAAPNPRWVGAEDGPDFGPLWYSRTRPSFAALNALLDQALAGAPAAFPGVRRNGRGPALPDDRFSDRSRSSPPQATADSGSTLSPGGGDGAPARANSAPPAVGEWVEDNGRRLLDRSAPLIAAGVESDRGGLATCIPVDATAVPAQTLSAPSGQVSGTPLVPTADRGAGSSIAADRDPDRGGLTTSTPVGVSADPALGPGHQVGGGSPVGGEERGPRGAVMDPQPVGRDVSPSGGPALSLRRCRLQRLWRLISPVQLPARHWLLQDRLRLHIDHHITPL